MNFNLGLDVNVKPPEIEANVDLDLNANADAGASGGARVDANAGGSAGVSVGAQGNANLNNDFNTGLNIGAGASTQGNANLNNNFNAGLNIGTDIQGNAQAGAGASAGGSEGARGGVTAGIDMNVDLKPPTAELNFGISSGNQGNQGYINENTEEKMIAKIEATPIQANANTNVNSNVIARGNFNANSDFNDKLEVPKAENKIDLNIGATVGGVDAGTMGNVGGGAVAGGVIAGGAVKGGTVAGGAVAGGAVAGGGVGGSVNINTNMHSEGKREVHDDQPKQTSNALIPNYFRIEKNDLLFIFDAYQRLNGFDEDIVAVEKYGGADEILDKIKTSLEVGIPGKTNTQDETQRIEYFGENKFIVEEMPHCCCYVWEGLEDLMVRILIVAAIFQLIVGSIPQIQESDIDFVEGLAIVFAVVVVVSVGSVINFTKEKKFRDLNDENQNRVTYQVRRNSKIEILKEEDILVGDIIMLELGNILPADGLLIEGSSVKIDEASLTGETDLVEKENMANCLIRQQQENESTSVKGKHTIPSPLVFSGTKAEEGNGWYVALRIGPLSEAGKIREIIEAEHSNKVQKKKKDGDDKGPDGENEGEKEGENEGENDDGKKKEEEEVVDEEEKKKTPLEAKLEELAEDISIFGLVSALATFVSLFIRFLIEIFKCKEKEFAILYERSNWFNTTMIGESPRKRELCDDLKIITKLLRIIILCIAIIVVAIPEGLPLAVTLSLAVSISKMMEDNNLVRQMSACEIMGGAEYICSDKTGTLTKNEMSVSYYFDCDKKRDFNTLVSKKETREDPSTYFNKDYFEIIKQSIALNSDSTFDEKDKIKKASKTDTALIEFLQNLMVNFTECKKKFYPPDGNDVQKRRIPFSSARKKMSTLISHSDFGHRIYLKGASEIILASCKFYLNPETGQKSVISDEKKNSYLGVIKNFADMALRTIVIAYKDISEDENNNWKEKDEDQKHIIEKDDFSLLGIFGIADKLRDGVPEAVVQCQKAGITVVMVTGDNIDTANAIAKDCNIVDEKVLNDFRETGKPYCMEGKAFYDKIGGMVCDICNQDCGKCSCPRTQAAADLMKSKKIAEDPKFDKVIHTRQERIKNFDAFKEIYESLRVIARSRPEDKYTMVYGLRELDKVVAVTGDGTNDAPALSKSDVGFAMGMAGTEIAKQAADIIILDDNFATIVMAVKWGRNIYDNIRKFVQFQLSVNITACIIVFLACTIGNETPLNAIQMLWVNMIMDSLGSLALATEPPYDELLNRAPNKKGEYIINSLMWKHIMYQSLVQIILLLVLYLYGHRFIPETRKEHIDIAKRIFKCFGRLPGREKGDEDYNWVIAGPSIFWSSDIELQPKATPLQCGNFFSKRNLFEAQHLFIATYGSAQITCVFNTFVIYTLFNQLNVRKIDDSYNIFLNLHLNYMFIILVLIEMLLQVIIAQFSGVAFRVSIYGLDGPQWGICIALSCITFLVNLILKPIPLQVCFDKMGECYYRLKRKKEEGAEEGAGEAGAEGGAKAGATAEVAAGGQIELQGKLDVNAKVGIPEEKIGVGVGANVNIGASTEVKAGAEVKVGAEAQEVSLLFNI